MSIAAARRGGGTPPLFREGRAALCLRVLCLLACVAVRLVALDADPPPWLSWSTGLYTDEGFYTLDARHQALFGTPAPGNFHDRLLSPLLSGIQQGVFAVLGVGLIQARLLSVVFGLLTIAVFWLALRRAYDTQTADIGALFLGLAPPFVFYNRLALQETPTTFWLVLGFALWTYSGRWPMFASGCALALAVVFKGLALIALPVLLVPPAPNNRGAGRLGLTPPLLGAGGLLVLYAQLWYWPHHAEMAWMAAFYRGHQIQPHSLLNVWLNIKRGLTGGERGVLPYLLVLLPVPCFLAGWGIRRGWTQPQYYLAVWLGSGLLFCLLSSYAPSRYYVLFLPALIGIAARTLTGWNRATQLVGIGLFLLTSAVWYGASWQSRVSARRDASRQLTKVLPQGSVVIGEFAPMLCLDTPFASVPVQPGLSNDDRPVERLQATDVVVTRTPYWEHWWRSRYPNIVQPSHRVATFTLGGSRHYVVDVYKVKSAGK